MKRFQIVSIPLVSLILFFLLISTVMSITGIFVVDGEVTEKILLGKGDIIIGNITAINGTIDVLMESPTGQVLFWHNKTEFRDFRYISIDDGTHILHVIRSNNSSDVTVKLDYFVETAQTLFDLNQIDVGGFFSFGITILVAFLIFRRRVDKLEPEQKEEGFYSRSKRLITLHLDRLGAKKSLVWVMFVVASLFAMWLSTRQILLFTKNYLFVEGYQYSQFQILSIVAYALTINLVFTLVNSLYKSDEKNKLDFIFSATIQAVLIGLILILPRYGDPETINRLGAIGFAFILISMGLLLAVLVFANKRQRHNSSLLCFI